MIYKVTGAKLQEKCNYVNLYFLYDGYSHFPRMLYRNSWVMGKSNILYAVQSGATTPNKNKAN